MRVFAHRGSCGLYPENSMLAFEKAWESGCGGIELDVQLTLDGEVVIIHDERVDRVTAGTGYVKDFPASDLPLIREVDLPIPRLREYLAWARDKEIVTNIEIKSSVFYYPSLEEKVAALVHEYHLDDQVLISSFNPLSLLVMKECAPHLPLGLLVDGYGAIGFDSLCKTFGFTSFHPDISLVTPDMVSRFREKEISIFTYTVNTEEELMRVLEAGVDGIFTNYPKRMTEALVSLP